MVCVGHIYISHFCCLWMRTPLVQHTSHFDFFREMDKLTPFLLHLPAHRTYLQSTPHLSKCGVPPFIPSFRVYLFLATKWPQSDQVSTFWPLLLNEYWKSVVSAQPPHHRLPPHKNRDATWAKKVDLWNPKCAGKNRQLDVKYEKKSDLEAVFCK